MPYFHFISLFFLSFNLKSSFCHHDRTEEEKNFLESIWKDTDYDIETTDIDYDTSNDTANAERLSIADTFPDQFEVNQSLVAEFINWAKNEQEINPIPILTTYKPNVTNDEENNTNFAIGGIGWGSCPKNCIRTYSGACVPNPKIRRTNSKIKIICSNNTSVSQLLSKNLIVISYIYLISIIHSLS